MTNKTSLSIGQTIYDSETPQYEIVEILDEQASDVIAKEEVKDRGHIIYEEQTVADKHPSYPETETVVKVRNLNTENESLWPISRVETELENLFEKN